MSNDKDRGRLSVFFSKSITVAAVILWLGFLGIAVWFFILDRCSTATNSIICFLKEWKTTFFSASVCVWGFTLTCVIFLFGRLEDVYYGTSLKRIVIMCFGKIIVIAYVFLYIILLPLMIVSYYKKMWYVNAWLQVINYIYSVGVISFISIISVRSTVIELIRDRTVKRLKNKDFDMPAYNDEKLAVLNMIRKLDYDDAWQCDRLQSIVVDMAIVAIKKNRIYAMYKVIQLIIQYAGYETRKERKRVVHILSSINKDISNKIYEEKFEDKKIKEAVVINILPILQVDIEVEDSKWMSQLISNLPLSMKRDVGIILMFGAEYLYDYGIFCESTVNELLNLHIPIHMRSAAPHKEELLEEIRRCWFNLNMYYHQGVQNEELCQEFVDDYIDIDKRVCTTKILLDLQARIIKKTRK